MKNSKNKRTAILGLVLVGLLVLAYKVMFVSTDGTSSADENAAASIRIEGVLTQIQSLNFDTSIVEDANFKSLRSIEIPLLSLPVGRRDPFAAIGSN